MGALKRALLPHEDSECPERLTPREYETLKLMARGLSNKEIQRELHLAPQTVKHYVSSIFHKTDTTNRIEAIVAMEWLTIPEG